MKPRLVEFRQNKMWWLPVFWLSLVSGAWHYQLTTLESQPWTVQNNYTCIAPPCHFELVALVPEGNDQVLQLEHQSGVYTTILPEGGTFLTKYSGLNDQLVRKVPPMEESILEQLVALSLFLIIIVSILA